MSKSYNKAGYDNEEAKQPRINPGTLGSGYAGKAADAIRENKRKKAAQLKELGY